VDASVGGKNGVNFQGYKNMVGVFNQPQFVICDLDLLKTLPRREILCGLGEVVKHALLGDAPLFSYLEEHYEAAVNVDRNVIQRLVHDSVVLKADIVGKDEREKGERRKLNFGHTFGHALEIQTDFNHGEAVSAGMMIACFASAERGYLDMETVERIGRLLENLHLPTSPPVAPQGILDALRKDKKRKGDSIHFVLLREIGHAVIEKISLGELEGLLQGFCDWEKSGPQ
jgi:3-dehydroquinate synthase